MGLRSLVIVLTAVFLFGTSQTAESVMLHTFDCNNCHKAGTTYATLDASNVCLSCHSKPTTAIHLNNALPGVTSQPDAGFVIGDASNALGSYPAGATEGKQNSHYWAAQNDVNAAAGAEAPVATQFYSRNGTSTGKVTCSRCHNPHGDSTQPQLLKLATAEAICKDCHRSWYAGAGNQGHLTHPLPSLTDGTYQSYVDDGTGRFRAIPAFDPAVSSSVAILPDGTMGCTSCHGAHFTDSDGTTADGPLATQGSGDGRMLRGNGALITDFDPTLQAQKRSNLCQSCHTYQLHGSVNPIGCLDCHSGHSYNGGNPNWFVLRSEATDIPMPKLGGAVTPVVSGLVYNSATFNWMDAGGNGYCQNCHTIPVDGAGKHNGLDVGSQANCVSCHGHGNTQVSFGGSCNSCHGYPPSTDTASGTTGYAVDPNAGPGFLNGYKFLDNGTTLRSVYKNETNTPHLAHAGVGAGEYAFACQECHVATFPVVLETHPNQSFQDVTFDALAATRMGTAPAYGTATPGSCSNVYCHSNGGARAVAPVAATIPGWNNGKNTISGCTSCHGNTAATMVTMVNSAGHQPHLGAGAILGKTYGCAVCHDQTAIDNTTLSATAIGGTHVDGQKDVLVTDNLLGVTDLGKTAVINTDGSCQSVYCHSDGKGTYKTPDWDTAATGTCNTCHDDTGASLSGAHQRHVVDADGPRLSCDTCHPAGANTGAHAGHIDGNLDKPADSVCAGCHGATTGVTTGNDREPQWLFSTSVDCETCHVGALAVINGRTAPAKDVFGTSGHGKTGVTKVCLDCHDGAGSGHLDATAGDNRLLTLGGGYNAAAPEVFCAACHTGTTETDHYGNGVSGGSLDGNHCNSCHDPHGAGLDAMILSTIGGRPVVGFADKSVRANYYVVTPSAAGYGICQVCHDPTDATAAAGDIKYFNTTTSTPGHYAGVCISCHKHDSTTAFTPSGCNGCHGDSVTEQYWPTGSGGTIPTANDDKGRHDEHVLLIGQSLGYGSYSPTMYTDTQQKAICAYCHTTPGADADHGNVLSLPADTAFHPLWNVGAVAAGSYDTTGDVQGTCSNIACHNSKATGSSTNAGNITAFGWKDAGTATCVMCHANVADGTFPNSTGGTHVAHTGATSTYGVSVTCATCHDSATVWNTTKPAVGHLNGTLDVNAPLSYVAGSCGTNNCHNDGTVTGAPAVTTYAWGTSEASACGICHTDTPATGKHGEHVGSFTYVAGSCNDCHDTNTGNALAAAAEATHLNAAVNTANKISVYSGTPAFTCTNACHTANTANDWSVTGTLACTDCHGSGIVTTPALDRGWPPTTVRTAAHAAHTDNSNYVSANCVDCHNNNVGGHSTLDDSVTSPTLGAKVSAYNSVAGTCTNTCHADSGADFHDSTPAPVCTDCHTSGMIGTVPASGLHATTVALAHDVSFGAGGTCDSCHAATPTITHIQGGAAQTSLQTTYYFNGTNVVFYGSAAGCAANCHSDAVANLGVGKWYRKWIGVTDAKPLATDSPGAAVCDNCHGDGIDKANGTSVDDLWNAGLDPVHGDADGNNGIEMIGQHAKCETCHGYGNDALYDRNWNVGSPGHGDGSISMNGPDAAHGPVAGAQYDEAAFGCLAACHSGSLTNAVDANFNHALADSTWPVNYGNYGSGDCDTCHAAAVPSRDHSDATENLGMHTTHVASGYVTDCTACHPHDGTSVAPGTGVHATGTVNFANQMLGATDYSATAFGGTCATANGCHDSAAGEWAAGSLGGNSCVDCHSATGKTLDQGGYPPPASSGEHSAHLANDAIFAPASDCDKCHGAGAVSGSHTGHKNNGASIDLDATVITTYNGTNCANTCHTSVASAWTSGVATLNCTDCHNAAGNTIGTPVHATLSSTVGPTTDKHAAHLANTTFVADCATCHTHNGALGNYATTGHVNGSNPTLVGTLTVYGDKSCANACHLAADANEWISGALNCNDCHSAAAKSLNGGGESDLTASVGPNAGRHDEHMASTNYVTAGCTDCHGHSGSLVVSSHVDGAKSLGSKLSTYSAGGCANDCHDVNVAGSGDWADTDTLACADCHASAGSLGQGAWPAATAAHSPHMASNALPGAAPQNDCYACHDSTIDNTGALKPAGNHLNNIKGDLVFNGSFNYEAGTAGRAAGAAATTTCSAVLCHNGVTTPTWGAVTITCGQCHNTAGTGPLPSGSIGGSHAAHANNDGFYTDCANCHTGAATYTAKGGTNHQNLIVELNRSYTDLDGGAGVNFAAPGTENGTCSAVDCHGGTVTPAWNGTFAGYKCTWCHNDGTVAQGAGALSNAVPTATKDIHGRHVVDAATAYVDDCNACHGATASAGTHTGHANQAITYGNSLAGYTGTNCTTNLCHDDAAGSLWANAATLTCGDCHAATGKTLAFGNTAVSATIPPADGKHTNHMGNFYVGTAGDRCTVCHTHAGSFAAASHGDGSQFTLDAAITYNVTNCANNCHTSGANAWVGAATLGCSDCHAAGKLANSTAPPVSNAHGLHVATMDSAYGTTTRKVKADGYDFACGQCHGAVATTHMDGSSSVVGVGYLAGNCSSNSCHQDGTGGSPQVVPNWTAGATGGDTCAKCHGNSPTSAAHGVHEIGIHSLDIYDQANGGILPASVAHGQRTSDSSQRTSTVITCQVCHNNTVKVSTNDLNSTCAGCHGSTAVLQGAMIIDSTIGYGNHVNGTKDVVFFAEKVKTKAQLRNDMEVVPEIGDNWDRANDGLIQLLFYKGQYAYDESATPLSAQTYAPGATPTCTVACHNGIPATWQAPQNNCMTCHTQLPK